MYISQGWAAVPDCAFFFLNGFNMLFLTCDFDAPPIEKWSGRGAQFIFLSLETKRACY